MDINCPKCGEPVDFDELHCVADENGTSFDTVSRQFRAQGCKALGSRCNPTPDRDTAAAASAMYELLGDDLDGAAAMLEDMGMGW